MRYCGHFLIKAEGGAKNYKRDHPLPLAWRSFIVTFVQRKGYWDISALLVHRFSLACNDPLPNLCYASSRSGGSARGRDTPDYKLEICSVSTNGDRSSPAIA